MPWVPEVSDGFPAVLKELQFPAELAFNDPAIVTAQEFRVVLLGGSQASFGIWQQQWFGQAQSHSDSFQFSCEIFVAENAIDEHLSAVRRIDLNTALGEQLHLG